MQYNAGYILRGQGFLIERSEARPGRRDAEIDSGDIQIERQEEDNNDDVK